MAEAVYGEAITFAKPSKRSKKTWFSKRPQSPEDTSFVFLYRLAILLGCSLSSFVICAFLILIFGENHVERIVVFLGISSAPALLLGERARRSVFVKYFKLEAQSQNDSRTYEQAEQLPSSADAKGADQCSDSRGGSRFEYPSDLSKGVTPNLLYQLALKRVLDVGIIILTLPLMLPMLGMIYMVVRLEGGPVLIGHERIGREGRPFKCWKFRTMYPDAEKRLRELLADNPEAAAEWARDFKLRDDPRITRLGAFLRASSLDELPQIWNVLRGEMSLVGPRPVTSDELARYGSNQWAYLMMRPGVTGLWQVSGRNHISYDERVALDTRYCREVSALKDMIILFSTVNAINRETGD